MQEQTNQLILSARDVSALVCRKKFKTSFIQLLKTMIDMGIPVTKETKSHWLTAKYDKLHSNNSIIINGSKRVRTIDAVNGANDTLGIFWCRPVFKWQEWRPVWQLHRYWITFSMIYVVLPSQMPHICMIAVNTVTNSYKLDSFLQPPSWQLHAVPQPVLHVHARTSFLSMYM